MQDAHEKPYETRTKWCLRIKPGQSFTDKNGDVYINDNPHVSLRLTVLRKPQRNQSNDDDQSSSKD